MPPSGRTLNTAEIREAQRLGAGAALNDNRRALHAQMLRRSHAQMRILGFSPKQMESGESEKFALQCDESGRRRIVRLDQEEPVLGFQPKADAVNITVVTVGGGQLYRLAANSAGTLTFGGPENALGRDGFISRININPISVYGQPYVPLSSPLPLGLDQAKRANNAPQLLPDRTNVPCGDISRFIRLAFMGNPSIGLEEDDVLALINSERGYDVEIVNFSAFAVDFTCDASVT